MQIPFRIWLRKLRYWRCPPFLPVLAAAVLLFWLFWHSLNVCLRPAMETLALSEATNRISETVSRAVTGCVADRQLTYRDFITMETDESGRVTALTNNLSSTSLLRSELVGAIAGELDGLRQESFGVPLGTLTGWIVFSGRGPEIQVELLSTGNVTCDLRHSFEQAGINQTLHRVMLDVSVTVFLMIPGETLSTVVENEICVAETVIVGQVPDTYLNIE